MTNETTPYITRNPGDLVTAEDWNELQREIQTDIGKQIAEAIESLTTVQNSENTHKIDDQTADELTNAILEKVRQELPARTGYLRLFKRVKKSPELIVNHGLAANPVVDLYQLERFEAICSEDGIKSKMNVLFYLYHTGEKKIRTKVDDGTTATAVIEPDGETPFRIPFSEMLSLYKVQYNDNSSLDNLLTEFWEAFFAPPNDEFDDDDYCRSPWFDKCCGDQRTVGELKQRGEWDDIWFKVAPRKTVNATISEAPSEVQVRQFDLNRLGFKLLPNATGETADERPIMMLLKV